MYSFSNLKNFAPIPTNNIEKNTDFLEVLDKDKESYVYIFGKTLYYGRVEKCYIVKEINLGDIDFNLLKSNKPSIFKVNKFPEENFYIVYLQEDEFIKNEKYIEDIIQEVQKRLKDLKKKPITKKRNKKSKRKRSESKNEKNEILVRFVKGGKKLFIDKSIEAIASTGSAFIFLEEQAIARIEIFTIESKSDALGDYFKPTSNYLKLLARYSEFGRIARYLMSKLKQFL
ncbi:MAG: hypothetical protein KME16_21290 [Scytolyngbya sp. HA4215-MV1]|jgi:hypothetical protein|nr:hypothetical protein [Scytolyngbya sp. HA4215-MV1]